MKRPPMYTRPQKPLSVPVPKRDWMARTITDAALPAPVVVHADSECHVTPPDVAAQMVDLLGAVCGVDVLEPSAGTGNLARAVLAAGADPARLQMVEMHTTLAAGLAALGRVECCDFLEWSPARTFDRIVMNPPFRRVRAHVSAARALLSPGGVLVALVPVTFSDDAFDECISLPSNTFATAKVNTKVITMRRA